MGVASYPIEGPAEDLADAIDAVVAFLRKGLNVVNGVPCVGMLDVVFWCVRCIHPARLERKI